jgi:2-desacetyl-2-hydroxyethyl bacteriochlorophyllide A dehydrogenase
MKALVYTAPHRVEVQSLPHPEPRPDEVVIKVAASGICGSDLHGFHGRSKIRVPPMVMGHEFTGVIDALGEGVTGLSVGERVVVQPLVSCGTCRHCASGRGHVCANRQLIGAHRQGAFAEYVVAPARLVYPISPALGDAEATLVEPLANALHMLGMAGSVLGQSVAVLGAGTLGLLTVAAAHLAGANLVIATDVAPFRLEFARQLGAGLTLDARDETTSESIREATDGGADLVIDAAGFGPVRRQAIEIAAPGATVIFLGLGEPMTEISFLDVINRELDLRGSYSCTDADFRHAIALLESGRIDASGWLRRATLDEGQRSFERLSAQEDDLVKVVFDLS